MAKRLVSLVLVPAILLSQGAGFAHVHRGTGMVEPTAHEVTPHVHLGPFVSHQDHGAPANHHHHYGDDDDHDSPDEFAPAGNHDDDAVYLPNVIAVGIPPQPQQSSDWITTVTSECETAASASPVACYHWFAHPPPLIVAGSCPLFLRTLHILI